jgi:hypothetical protein
LTTWPLSAWRVRLASCRQGRLEIARGLATPGEINVPRRRFTLLDAMILVTATACVLLVDGNLRFLAAAVGRVEPGRLRDPSHLTVVVPLLVRAGLQFLVICLVLATPTVLLLRMMRPRPPLPELMRQPGVHACGVATVAQFLFLFLKTFAGTTHPVLVPFAVAVDWAWLASTRRWRSEASWVDRAGWAIGVGWLLLFVPFAWLEWTAYR